MDSGEQHPSYRAHQELRAPVPPSAARLPSSFLRGRGKEGSYWVEKSRNKSY